MATGSVTPSITVNGVTPSVTPAAGSISRIAFLLTSDASGNVDIATTATYSGLVLAGEFVPGASASSYSGTINDLGGVDIFNGLIASMSATVPTMLAPAITCSDGTNKSAIPRPISDQLHFVFSGIGNVKTVQVILYVRNP